MWRLPQEVRESPHVNAHGLWQLANGLNSKAFGSSVIRGLVGHEDSKAIGDFLVSQRHRFPCRVCKRLTAGNQHWYRPQHLPIPSDLPRPSHPSGPQPGRQPAERRRLEKPGHCDKGSKER